MTTSALTLAEFQGKFDAISAYVTADTLALVNRSETLKELIRSYQASDYTKDVKLDTQKAGIAEYYVPTGSEGDKRGYVNLGTDRVNTPEGFVQILSHELGHYVVENPSAVIANARENARAVGDAAAFEASCHMTEGYARLATAKVIDEITAGPLDGVTRARLTGAEEYKQYKALLHSRSGNKLDSGGDG